MLQYKPSQLTLETLETLFAEDKELCDQHHIIAPASPRECALRTLTDLQQAPGFSSYLVFIENNLIGYFGLQRLVEGNFLTGFFISPAVRRRPVVKAFWSIITNEFKGLPFACGVYAKNTRAVSFLEKSGKLLETIQTGDGPVKLFLIAGENS